MKTVVLSMKWPSLVAKKGKNSSFPKKKSLVRSIPGPGVGGEGRYGRGREVEFERTQTAQI